MKMNIKNWWNDVDGKNRSTDKKTCSVATVSTNFTWTDLELKLGLHGVRLVTNHQSHTAPTGMAALYR